MSQLRYDSNDSPYYKYKLDHIFQSGNSIYFAGQQYMEKFTGSTVIYGATINNFAYSYMGIIVAKQGINEKIEWLSILPFRKDVSATRQEAFKQYAAVLGTNKLYIINNEHPDNQALFQKQSFKYDEFKSLAFIHGSNLVCSEVNTGDGKTLKRTLLSKNEEYCFSPMKGKVGKLTPRSDNDVFVTENSRIYLYLDHLKNRYRFATIKFD
ncbi:MAG: hypothetical protein IPJ32_01275 [Sphingobacteriaceae bacterium]|nr:hypothetical protein [Sphingobacteriaceae bacterium]